MGEKEKTAKLWEELNENKMKTVSSLHSFRKYLWMPAICCSGGSAVDTVDIPTLL